MDAGLGGFDAPFLPGGGGAGVGEGRRWPGHLAGVGAVVGPAVVFGSGEVAAVAVGGAHFAGDDLDLGFGGALAVIDDTGAEGDAVGQGGGAADDVDLL